MKTIFHAITLLLLLSSSLATLADEPDAAVVTNPPESLNQSQVEYQVLPMDAGTMQNYSPVPGLYFGLGGSYNSVKLDQNLFASGVSDVFSGTTLVAFGEAGGPAIPYRSTETTFAPTAQIGYFRNLPDSDWLWGANFSYKYLGLTFSQAGIDSPQAGSFTNTGAAPADTSFTGNVVIEASQTSVNHELALIPFIGRSFENSRVYLGAGPVVFETKSQIYKAIGFADINGERVDITGTPIGFTDNTWMWGGAAKIGVVYNLNPSWFLDLSYSFIYTATYTNDNSSPFSSASSGFTDTGTLFVNTSQRLVAQSLTLAIGTSF